MAYADDFSAAGNLRDLRRWWSVLTEIGPKFSYYTSSYWWTYTQQRQKETAILTCETWRYGNCYSTDIAKTEYQNLRNITESLTKLHLEQTTEYNINRDELAKLNYDIKKEKLQRNKKRLQSLIIDLPTNKIHLNKINQVKSAST